MQIDGAPMGGSASSSLANIFLSHHEKIWLQECPLSFKPVYYRRYVDDTFLLFKSINDIEPFKNYLNSKHRKIIFTSEIEIEGKLNFLDVSVSRNSSSFSTNTFIKPTDKGLSLKFDSAVSIKYKTNLISCLINRAHKNFFFLS